MALFLVGQLGLAVTQRAQARGQINQLIGDAEIWHALHFLGRDTP
jgi:hypothetical protein